MCLYYLKIWACGHLEYAVSQQCQQAFPFRGNLRCSENLFPTLDDTEFSAFNQVDIPCADCRSPPQIQSPGIQWSERALQNSIFGVYDGLDKLQSEYQDAGVRYHRLNPNIRIDSRVPEEVGEQPYFLFAESDAQSDEPWFADWREADRLAGEAQKAMYTNGGKAFNPDGAGELLKRAYTALNEARQEVHSLDKDVERLEVLQQADYLRGKSDFGTPEQRQVARGQLRGWVRTLPETEKALAIGWSFDEVVTRVMLSELDGPAEDDGPAEVELES